MPKPIWCLRLESWVIEDVTHFAKVHKLYDLESGEIHKTEALHGLLKELKESLVKLPSLESDLETWKSRAQYLEKDQPVYCGSMDTDVSKQYCFNCATMKKRPSCTIGFDIKNNGLTVEASHGKYRKEPEKTADAGQTGTQGVTM